MQKIFAHSFRSRRKGAFEPSAIKKEKTTVLYSENFLKEELVTNMRARILAIGIFLYYFVENGTLGLVPSKFYFVYRNIRISDLLLYGMTLYSLLRYKEYKELFNSKPFLVAKLIILYFLFEFAISSFRYGYNPIEFFFRLKGIWTSFLVFPYMLLIKRGGLPFLIKLIFPIAVISNLLYLLTALTGIPFLPDVSIVRQRLPGDIEVFRVFGGTFFGEMFFLGIVYYWITKRFRAWQLGLVALFVIPHILAFGRLAWVGFVFTILVMILLNSLNKKNYQILFRQAVLLIVMGLFLMFAFIKFIPESDFYIDALNARIFQGQEDVKYGEGTYGTRTIMQNAALVQLWLDSDILIGVGMHPMWVLGPDSREEAIYYGAFCDVTWPGVLAAYGIIGFSFAFFLQIYYMVLSFRLLKRSRESTLYTLLLTFMLSKLLFDCTVGFSYVFLSTGLWGFFHTMNLYIPVFIFLYEKDKREKKALQPV